MSTPARDTVIADPASSSSLLQGLVGYHLRRASAAIATDFKRALSGTGMRQVPFGVLSVIAEQPGINQGAVGRLLGIQRANMVALINELIDAGLVDRREAVDNRRAFALQLSAKGVETVRACERRIAVHEEAMLADLSAGERRTLIDLLSRIAARGE